MGGLEIETEEQLAGLMEIPRVRLKVAAENLERAERGEPERSLEVGDFLSMPPCLPPVLLRSLQKETGRECPRVELDPANHAACSLFTMLTRDHTRPLALSVFEGEAREWGWSKRRRLRVKQRAVAAMLDPEIAQALMPRPPQQKK